MEKSEDGELQTFGEHNILVHTFIVSIATTNSTSLYSNNYLNNQMSQDDIANIPMLS